jgi:2-polyprenyl-3-methyl-5-hydroxy-6-metoxy-1,4-benzoquinol methylase
MTDDMNNTLLDPLKAAEINGPIHRDYLAHCLRWAFVGRLIGSNETIADIGAGVGNLEETLWRNKLRPKIVYAIEVHPAFITKLKELAPKLNFRMEVLEHDLRKMPLPLQNNHCDTVTCFEVVEHFDPKHLNFVLSELARVVKPDGRVLLSTPNYDGIHKAENHIHEYTEAELQQELEKHFIIVRKFGTFMSTGLPKQAKLVLTPGDYNLFMRLREYYSPNLLSVLFAPVYPSQSRNILWVLKKKVVVEDDSHPFSELITPKDMDSTPA